MSSLEKNVIEQLIVNQFLPNTVESQLCSTFGLIFF